MHKLSKKLKTLTGILLFTVFIGTGHAAKWKELVFTDDVSLGMAELDRYCMTHDFTAKDVFWANNIESADIKPGQSLYLPANHADLLAIWQNRGAWQPTALVPVTSAAAAKRAVQSEPKPEPKPTPKPAPIETVTVPPAPIVMPEVKVKTEETPIDDKTEEELIAQLREEVKTDERNLPPEPETQNSDTVTVTDDEKLKAEAETETLPEPKQELKAEEAEPVKPERVETAKTETIIPEIKPKSKAKSLTIPTAAPKVSKRDETPQRVIADTARPDKILTGKQRKSAKNELASLNDPIIILSPNGDPSKGPMRLVISGDKVEVVQLPKNAAPKRPSIADLNSSFGVNPSYLPHYNLTPKPRKDPFVFNMKNMGNLTGKMLWPVDGKISSPFGKWRGSHKHQGIDIPMPSGTPIRAARNGIVSRTGNNSTMGFRGYGNFVLMDHGDGIQTFYAHCLSVAVIEGQRIMQGQVIGYVGSTGRSTANHLHFEVRVNNTKVDPVPYMAGNTHFASTKQVK